MRASLKAEKKRLRCVNCGEGIYYEQHYTFSPHSEDKKYRHLDCKAEETLEIMKQRKGLFAENPQECRLTCPNEGCHAELHHQGIGSHRYHCDAKTVEERQEWKAARVTYRTPRGKGMTIYKNNGISVQAHPVVSVNGNGRPIEGERKLKFNIEISQEAADRLLSQMLEGVAMSSRK